MELDALQEEYLAAKKYMNPHIDFENSHLRYDLKRDIRLHKYKTGESLPEGSLNYLKGFRKYKEHEEDINNFMSWEVWEAQDREMNLEERAKKQHKKELQFRKKKRGINILIVANLVSGVWWFIQFYLNNY